MVDLDFKRIEEKWRKFWEEEKIYKFNPETKKEIYSIDTPPPTSIWKDAYRSRIFLFSA